MNEIIYFFTIGWAYIVYLWDLTKKLFIFESIAAVNFPFVFLTDSNFIDPYCLYYDLNFSKVTRSSNFKKFSKTWSAFNYGIYAILFRYIYNIILLLFKCLSSYRRYCPFLAIGGTGIPGCNFYKMFDNHKKSLYLRSTVLPKQGVLMI